MHTIVRAEEAVPHVPADIIENVAQPVELTAALTADSQKIATGDVLFQPGDQRRHYRVEEGAIFHYIRWTDGSHDLIEVAFPGDVVGLGHISTHISTAQAMVDTVVTPLSDEELDSLIETDVRLPLLLISAGEREFEYLRDTTINCGKRTPVERLANYLMAVANTDTASQPLVAEDISSGYVADRLKMSLDTLSSALVGLQHKGLVEPYEHGLKITDVAELERVANAA